MQHVYIATVSSLSLIAGLLFWDAPGRAQSICYLVDTEGRTVNLEHLCGVSDDASLPSPPEEQPAQEPAEAGASENTVPGVRSFTIIGPVVDPDAPEEGATEPVDDASPEDTEANPNDTSSETSPADTEANPNNTSETSPADTEANPDDSTVEDLPSEAAPAGESSNPNGMTEQQNPSVR